MCDYREESYQLLRQHPTQLAAELAFLEQKPLLKFLQQVFDPHKAPHLPLPSALGPILVVGSGLGILNRWLETHGWYNEGVDISPTACRIARSLGDPITYHCADFLEFKSPYRYGLIMDNHALHTITTSAQRSRYWQQVGRLLYPHGFFLCEHGVDEEKTYSHPQYFLPPTHALEEELLVNHFTPYYFRLCQELVLQLPLCKEQENDQNCTPQMGGPRIIRMIARPQSLRPERILQPQ